MFQDQGRDGRQDPAGQKLDTGKFYSICFRRKVINDQKVSAIETTFGCEQFTGDGVIIKKGKKVFHRAVLV